MIEVSTKCDTPEELQSMLEKLVKSGFKAEIIKKGSSYVLCREPNPDELSDPKWVFDGKSFTKNEDHKFVECLNICRRKKPINRRVESMPEQNYYKRHARGAE